MTFPKYIEAFVGHPFIALLVGSSVTWIVTWWYYKRAGDELECEAARLQKINEIILRWLENEGCGIEVIRDPSGRPMGIRHNVNIVEAIQVSASVTAGELGVPGDNEQP
jgi:hypothetical protein